MDVLMFIAVCIIFPLLGLVNLIASFSVQDEIKRIAIVLESEHKVALDRRAKDR